MEWVVETGALIQVAKLTHKAAEIIAASIAQIRVCASASAVLSMMLPAMVWATSPPASSAPALSQIAAMAMAPPIDSTRAPTAGPM